MHLQARVFGHHQQAVDRVEPTAQAPGQALSHRARRAQAREGPRALAKRDGMHVPPNQAGLGQQTLQFRQQPGGSRRPTGGHRGVRGPGRVQSHGDHFGGGVQGQNGQP